MKRNVRLERTYPHPPELVWRVITNPELLARWLMPNDFRAEVGHAFTMRSEPQPGWDGLVYLSVLQLEAPRRMQWSWRGGPLDTVVTFSLDPTMLDDRPATRLVLEHTGFDSLPAMLVSFILGAGWKRMLRKAIPSILDGLAVGGEIASDPDSDHGGSWRVLAWLFSPILRRSARR